MQEISIIQNFICSSQERLDFLKSIVPKMAEVLNPFPIFVNYDTELYRDEVETLYKTHFTNLYFQSELNLSWNEPVLKFLSLTDSPYILYLCEDMVFDETLTRDKFLEVFEEFKHNNCCHLGLAKTKKYMMPEWHTNSIRGKHLWLFHSSNSPYNMLSVDALFERSIFENQTRITYGKGLPALDSFEYSRLHHRNFNCCCPTEPIIVHTHPNGVSERHK